MQWIDSIEIYAYGKSKDHEARKERLNVTI